MAKKEKFPFTIVYTKSLNDEVKTQPEVMRKEIYATSEHEARRLLWEMMRNRGYWVKQITLDLLEV